MGNKIHLVDIHYLVNSEECLLLDFIAKLGSKEEVVYKEKNYNCDREDFLEVIIKKLFRKPCVTNARQYLKNKYLYYLTGGSLGYLEAIYSMKYKDEIDKEIKGLEVLFEKTDINLTEYNLVSIGCGEGSKDIKIIEDLFKPTQNFNYYPIDISPFLLQLTVNRFVKRILKEGISINPINADFFDFNESDISSEIKSKFSTKPKIFMLLGGTIGNYKEDDLINSVKKIMSEDDFLVVSFELYGNESELQTIANNYFTSGNVEFLSNPIGLIPNFSGYLKNKTKYFKLYDQGFVDKNDDESVFDESKVYRPKLIIPTRKDEFVIAWTTRYKELKLTSSIQEKLRMKLINSNDYNGTFFVLLKKSCEIKKATVGI